MRIRKLFRIFHIKKAIILSKQQGLRVNTRKLGKRIKQDNYTDETETRVGKEYLLYNDKLIIANDSCITTRYDLSKVENYSLTLHDDSIFLCLFYLHGKVKFEILKHEVEGELNNFHFKLAKIFYKHFG